jgi:uncharacterized glyoxalase superfamily protein PhnB
MDTKTMHARIIPGMRYRNAPAAIEWLCKAFGFEKNLVVPDQNGGIAHAQLTFGDGMIMLGSVGGGMFGRLMKHPDEIGGCETQSAYVIVADCDAQYSRAKAAGAVMLRDVQDEDYGGRGYTCRDLEGHIWSFGSYDPWVQS